MSHPLPRARCPGCQTQVPVLPPRDGTSDHPTDLGWRYRAHGDAWGSGRRCAGSGATVMAKYMPDELSTSPSTP